MIKAKCLLILLLSLVLIYPAVLHAETDSDSEIRIGVMEFQSGTIDVYPEQAIVVGNNFTQRLADIMPSNFVIIGHGQLSKIASDNQLSTEGYVSNRDAAKIAQLAGCRYIIAGIVTDLKTRSASTGVNFIVRLGRKIDVANAAADIRVIDAETGEVVLSISDSARATQRDSTFSYSAIDSGRSDINGMEAAAIFLLNSKSTMRISEAIAEKYAEVISVSKKEVVFNIGTSEGAKKGLLYRIYVDDKDSGQNIAVVKVTEVNADSSKAVLYSKGYGNLSLVRTGDRVFPTDIYEMRPVVKKKLFMKRRTEVE